MGYITMTMLNKTKYGVVFSKEQLKGECEFLHKEIHRLLYSEEEKDPQIINYFDKLQRELAGMNELLLCRPELVTLMSLLEAARLEVQKPDFDHSVYRNIIFDSHSVLDRLFRGDANDNTEGKQD